MYDFYLKPCIYLCFSLLLAGCGNKKSPGESGEDQVDPRPNIVLILADDLGYSDLGCYGGEIRTPNLDYLAENGLRFTRFYNTSRCCPSRASLLTGLYNHDAGIGEMTTDRNIPGYRGYITENTVTLAEVLGEAGYQTGMSGKWHVSNTVVQDTPEKQLAWLNHQEFHPLFAPIEQYPTRRGFDRYFGNIWGVVDFFDPFSLVSGTTPVREVPEGYYHTDAINDTAVAYIDDFSRKKSPFFLYVAHTAPHWPLMAPEEDIEKYADTYKSGWEAIRKERYARMTAMGLIDSTTTVLSPQVQEDLSWEDNPDKEWDARAMAVHAAMIDRMDRGIGRIIDKLKATGEIDNTIIVFLSDNGASSENAAAYGPGFDRPGETRNGEQIVYDTEKEHLPGPQTVYSSIGKRWANVANTPFRLWKAQSYEGGIRTPMIAFWPRGIQEKGGITDQVAHVMDFMATFAQMGQAPYPESFNGNDILPLQGKSLVPVFEGKKREGHTALFNEHFGARYVRQGHWKLVKRNRQDWHLYDVEKDQSETRNLAAAHPDKVKELDSLWQHWAKSHQVLPKP